MNFNCFYCNLAFIIRCSIALVPSFHDLILVYYSLYMQFSVSEIRNNSHFSQQVMCYMSTERLKDRETTKPYSLVLMPVTFIMRQMEASLMKSGKMLHALCFSISWRRNCGQGSKMPQSCKTQGWHSGHRELLFGSHWVENRFPKTNTDNLN